MDEALSQLLALNAQVEANLGKELDALAAREADAQRILAECFEERQRVDRKMAGLKEAARVYRESFGGNNLSNSAGASRMAADAGVARPVATSSENGGSVGADSSTYRPARARIGPQRFLILDAINTMGQMSMDDIEMFTKLTMRRVKDQLASDMKLGVVTQSGDMVTLTSAGMDLLERFKAYKRANNQPLPTFHDAPVEDERDEVELAVTSEAYRETRLPEYFIDDHDGRLDEGA